MSGRRLNRLGCAGIRESPTFQNKAEASAKGHLPTAPLLYADRPVSWNEGDFHSTCGPLTRDSSCTEANPQGTPGQSGGDRKRTATGAGGQPAEEDCSTLLDPRPTPTLPLPAAAPAALRRRQTAGGSLDPHPLTVKLVHLLRAMVHARETDSDSARKGGLVRGGGV